MKKKNKLAELAKANAWKGLALVIGVFCIGGLVFAAGNSITNNFYDNSSADQRAAADNQSSEDANLGGGSRFTDSYIYAGEGFFADYNNGYGIGTFNKADGSSTYVPYLTDGYVEKILSLTMTNTSSVGLLNPEGETIWVYDATYITQTATTSSVLPLMGTSTVAWISGDYFVGKSIGGDGKQSILKGTSVITTSNLVTATTTLWRADNYGTDSRDASGVQYVIPVYSTEYLTCYASSTPKITGYQNAMGTYQSQCQFKYYVLKD